LIANCNKIEPFNVGIIMENRNFINLAGFACRREERNFIDKINFKEFFNFTY
jgi:hypothetical protein